MLGLPKLQNAFRAAQITKNKKYILEHINDQETTNQNTILHIAILQIDFELLQAILSKEFADKINFLLPNKDGMTTLHLAIVQNLPRFVEAILKCPAFISSVTAKDINNLKVHPQPLALEAINSDLPIDTIKLLIESGADINLVGKLSKNTFTKNLIVTHETTILRETKSLISSYSHFKNNKMSALYAAIARQNTEATEFLLTSLNIDLFGINHGYNLVHHTILTNGNNFNMVHLITNLFSPTGAVFKKKSEFLFAYNDKMEKLKYNAQSAIEEGENFIHQGNILTNHGTRQDEGGEKLIQEGKKLIEKNTRLVEMISEKENEMIEHKKGVLADIYSLMVQWTHYCNMPDDDGNTPLHLAVENASFEVIKYLLDSDKVTQSLSVENNEGDTPLRLASKRHPYNEAIFIQFFDKWKKNYDSNQLCVVHAAAIYDNYETMLALLEDKNFNRYKCIDLPDAQGDTPLHHAIQHHSYKTMALIMAHDANLLTKNKKGYLPTSQPAFFTLKMPHIHRAVIANLFDVVKTYVCEKPERVHQLDSKGNTPLHYAVFSKNSSLITLLLLNGANPSATNVDGISPISFSEKYNMLMSLFSIARYWTDKSSQSKTINDTNEKAASPEKPPETRSIEQPEMRSGEQFETISTLLDENASNKPVEVKIPNLKKKKKKKKKNAPELQPLEFDNLSRVSATPLANKAASLIEIVQIESEKNSLNTIPTAAMNDPISQQENPIPKISANNLFVKPFVKIVQSPYPPVMPNEIHATINNCANKLSCLNAHRPKKSWQPAKTGTLKEGDVELVTIPYSEWGIKTSRQLNEKTTSIIDLAKKYENINLYMVGSGATCLLIGNTILKPSDIDLLVSCSKENEGVFLSQLETIPSILKIKKHEKDGKYSYELIFKDKDKIDLTFTQQSLEMNLLDRDATITAIFLDLINDNIISMWEQLKDLLLGDIRQLTSDSFDQNFFRALRALNLNLKLPDAGYKIIPSDIDSIKNIKLERTVNKDKELQFIYSTIKHLSKVFNHGAVDEILNLLSEFNLLEKIKLQSDYFLVSFITLDITNKSGKNHFSGGFLWIENMEGGIYKWLKEASITKLAKMINSIGTNLKNLKGEKLENEMLHRDKLIFQLCCCLLSVTNQNDFSNTNDVEIKKDLAH